MNKQEVFTRVVQHLLKQGAKSLSYTGSCRYRGEEGRRCAVGCLITGEAYDRGIEGYRADSGVVILALEESGINARQMLPLLSDLQTVHDKRDPVDWLDELTKLAEKHELVLP